MIKKEDTYAISITSPEQLEEIEAKVLERLVKHTDKHMAKYFKKEAQNKLERDSEMERHTQQVESFLGSIEKLIKARL